jgi:hypothetical protein
MADIHSYLGGFISLCTFRNNGLALDVKNLVAGSSIAGGIRRTCPLVAEDAK